MDVRVTDSALCRLCAADNPHGSPIFVVDEDGANLSELINSYLPLKVYDDGKYSRTICPGCNIQLEATVGFFNLIINGQLVLRELLQQEKSKDIQDALGKSTTEDVVYSEEHPLSLQMAGLDKPKRKRGRPKKVVKPDEEVVPKTPVPVEQATVKAEDTPIELVGKRRRKAPERLKETVQGKELERIFREEGVIDGEESDGEKSEDVSKTAVETEPVLDEVIGHMQTADGKPIGEPIRINKGKGRGRPKGRMEPSQGPTRPNKQNCIICGAEFSCLGRYMSHVAQHGPVSYQCAECNATFATRLLFNEHQEASEHRGQNIIKSEPDDLQEQVSEPANESPVEVNILQESAPTLHQMLSDPTDTALPNRPASTTNPEPQLQTEETTTTEDTYVVHVPSLGNNQEFADMESMTVENLNGNTIMATENPDLLIKISKEDNESPNNIEEILQPQSDKTATCESNPSEEPSTDVSKPQPSGKLKCPHCDKMFSTKQSKSMHIKALHAGERPYACDTCGARFPYPRSLTLHALSHRKTLVGHKGYACDLCGKVLNHPSSVVYHKEAEHAGQKFECIKCGKLFKHRQLLQRHQLVHTQTRPYLCKLCPASFKTKTNLINHQSLHTGIKKFHCLICKQTFAHKTSLTLHMRWHSGQKPFQCSVCNKSFTQRGNLIEHHRTHTGEKPYACDQCPRAFTTSSQHRLHRRRHAGDKPYVCTHCGKRFMTNEAWRAHVRRENGQLEHWCGVCGRGFAERWALLKHQRCHTGEKPHVCPHCPRAFADASNLAKHKKTHKTSLLVQGSKRPASSETPATAAPTSEPEAEEEKVFYVTYSVDGNGAPRTYRILNPEQTANLDESKVLTTCSLYEGDSVMVGDEQIELATLEQVAQSDETDIGESALYMEQEMDGLMMHSEMSVTDEEGNPIQLTMQDGTTIEITAADGKSIQVLTEDGQTIPIDLNDFKVQDVQEEGAESPEAAESAGVRMLALDDPALAQYYIV